MVGGNAASLQLCWMHRYDSHREAILRSGETHQAGGDGGVTPGQRPSDEVDPFQYFSTSCYSGYNDGAKVQHINLSKLTLCKRLYSADQMLPQLHTTYVATAAVGSHADHWSNKVTARYLFCLIIPLCNANFCHRQFGAKPLIHLCVLQGFYTVYNSVFQKLAQEERQAAAQQSHEQSADSMPVLPAFGKLWSYY